MKQATLHSESKTMANRSKLSGVSRFVYDYEFKSKLIKMHFLEGVPAHEICDKYNVHPGAFSQWKSMFLRAGIERLQYDQYASDIITVSQTLKTENTVIKKALDTAIAKYEIIRSLHRDNITTYKNKKYSPLERLRILKIFAKRNLPVQETCNILGIAKCTIYRWIGRYKKLGVKGLLDSNRKSPELWNRIDSQILD
ncbi:helix-turn-helix domain-containing protein, partial [Candidatus Neomarinimicrobiota bacterium]